MHRLSSLLLVLALVSLGHAQTVTTWISNNGGDWNTATNWDLGVPNATSTAVLPLPVIVTISGTTPVSVANLTISSGALSATAPFSASLLEISGSAANLSFTSSVSLGQVVSTAVAINIILGGNANVTGSFSVAGNASITGSGSLEIAGAFSITGNVAIGVSFTSSQQITVAANSMLVLGGVAGSELMGTVTLNGASSLSTLAGTHTWTAQIYGTSASVQVFGGEVLLSSGYCEPAVQVTGGQLQFWKQITLRSLSLGYGALQFSHNSTVETLTVWADNATFSSLTVDPSSVLNIAQTLTWINEGTNLVGTVTLLASATGNFSASTYIGGVFSLNNYGSIQFVPSPAIWNEFIFTGTINNYGTFQFSPESGDFYFDSTAAIFNNMAGAVFNASLIGFHYIDGEGALYNYGTLNTYSNTGRQVTLSLLNAVFENRGVLSLHQTTFDDFASGTHTGHFVRSTDSIIAFLNGTVTLNDPCQIDDGSETSLVFGGATVTINTSKFFASLFTSRAGSVTFLTPYTTNSSLTIAAGEVDFRNTALFRDLTLDAAVMGVSGTVNITGNFYIYTGDLKSNTNNQGTINLLGYTELSPVLSEGGSIFTNVAIYNYGTLAYIPDDVCDVTLTSSSIINNVGAQLLFTNILMNPAGWCGDASSFLTNYGTVTVSQQTSGIQLNLPAHFNGGSLSLTNTSQLTLSGQISYANVAITVSSDSTLIFGTGAHAFAGGVTLTAPGWVQFLGAFSTTGTNQITLQNLNVGAGAVALPEHWTATLDTFSMSGGSLQLNGNTSSIQVQKTFTWVGGLISGQSSSISVLEGCNATVMNLAGNDTALVLSQVSLSNAGTFSLETGYGLTLTSGATVSNTGTFSVSGNGTDAYIHKGTNPGFFANNGKLVVPSGKILHLCVSLQPEGTTQIDGCLDTSCDGTMCGSGNTSSEDHTGLIIGGSIGGFLLLAVLVGAVVYVVRRKRRNGAEVGEDSALLSGGKPAKY